MTRKRLAQVDPIEHQIELALNPGAFIPDRACFSFVGELDEVAARIGAEWEKTVSQVRVEHNRKIGFMSAFERLVGGMGPSDEPSFLEKAKARWTAH